MHDKKPYVLVVDDQQPAADMLSRLFTNHGYEAVPVYGGQEALDLIGKRRPDLVLLDIMMPGINGLEVLERLRASPSTATIPTILVTADDRTATLERGMNLGADDFIAKPVQPREILARARSKLEASRLSRDLQNRTKDLEALLRVGEELNSQLLAVDELLDLVLYLLLDLLPCQIALIYHFDDAGDIANYRARLEDSTLYDPFFDPGPLLAAMQSFSQPFTWDDARFQLDRCTCGAAVTLQHGGQMQGLIVMLAENPFDYNQRRLLEGIGRQATLALRNAEAYELKQHYAEKLEQTVEERTRELRSAQQMLIQAEKLASIGRLSGNIAHEINNPLTPILLNMEGMIEDIRAGIPPAVEDLKITMQSAQRIKRIVDRLQQFTRRPTEEVPQLDSLDMVNVLHNVIGLSRRAFESDELIITTDFGPIPELYGSRDQLEQVFLNMMLNARAAMSPGDTLTIRARVENSNVIIEFADTGCGIQPEIIDKIFEPFIGTRPDSNGLGLYISYEIIQNHNGSIQVTSEVGQGTTFTITIPIVAQTTTASS